MCANFKLTCVTHRFGEKVTAADVKGVSTPEPFSTNASPWIRIPNFHPMSVSSIAVELSLVAYLWRVALLLEFHGVLVQPTLQRETATLDILTH